MEPRGGGPSFATTVVGFALVRYLLGLGEATNFPACVKAVAEWFPKHQRLLATGIFNTGTNFGAMQLTYDRRRFAPATIKHKMRKLVASLDLMASRSEVTLGELAEELAALDRERARAAVASMTDVAHEKLKAPRRGAVVS